MNKLRHVLLVEDDEFTRFMMQEIISTLGVSVVIAIDGKDAIDRLSKEPDVFGLVLMDLHMPTMSGIDATRIIRKNEDERIQKMPVIALTADVNYHDDSVVESFGMDGYAVKPITRGQLLRVIEQHCIAA